jgi:hypothetical protein
MRYIVGTKIRFNQTLEGGPTSDRPAVTYAFKGEAGEIVGHGTKEGYWVQTDMEAQPFGASDTEFDVVKEN